MTSTRHYRRDNWLPNIFVTEGAEPGQDFSGEDKADSTRRKERKKATDSLNFSTAKSKRPLVQARRLLAGH